MNLELGLCPWCKRKPTWQQGKLRGCQLHGDPIQSVVIACTNPACPVRPRLEHGDIYSNIGKTQTHVNAAKIWNDGAGIRSVHSTI